MTDGESSGRLGFLDSLTQFFRREEPTKEPRAAAPKSASDLAGLQTEFEAALDGLNRKVQERLAQSAPTGTATSTRRETAEEKAAARLQRMDACHRAIREDVEKMHARLRTGLGSKDLDDVSSFLKDLDVETQEGKDSHAMLPRARYSIARRFESESGGPAVARLLDLMQRENVAWPDPTGRGDSTAEEAERSRRRHLAETKEAFLASGLKRTADRMLGVVSAWGSDYPDRGSPLWEGSVLEAVAAGIRGDLLKEYVEILRRDVEQINAKAEVLVGKEIAALQHVLQGGVTSIEKANQAMASALRVLDEVVPQIAWEHVQSQSARARGEWNS